MTLKKLTHLRNILDQLFSVGTKSVLFGAHCFFLHPLFVAVAWTRLYGFPLDPRLWCAFVLHDIGYLFKTNIDGKEGKTHPELGAYIMGCMFDSCNTDTWHDFCLYHSRWYAELHGRPVSKLCAADKLAFCLEPYWFYMIRVRLSGEVKEYFKPGSPLKDQYDRFYKGNMRWVDQQRA